MESRSRLVPQLGSVNELYFRIQTDPDFLENFDDLPFIHTPLHEASAAGKIVIAMELMILKPSLAKKLNADGFSPLHLAVENNHVELALRLVNCDPSLIRFPGREGMTPLHLVARNGGVDLLANFILVCPESIRDVNVNGETALHITVIHDRYEELKVLIGWMQKLRSSDALNTEIHVLNSCDHQGNTALHLAAKENTHKVVKQLLKCMSLNRNIMNKLGKTPLDVLRENGAHMNKYSEKLIQKSGGTTKKSILGKVNPPSDVLRAPVNFWVYCSTRLARYRSRMPDNTRNALLVIAALIITATYTTAIQEDKLEDKTISEMLDRITLPNGTMVNMTDILMTEKSVTKIAKSPEFLDKKREILLGMVLLCGFNTTAYLLSVVWTFILLPAGREYTIWYTAIIATLTTSFGLSTYRKYTVYNISTTDDPDKSIYINIYFIAVVLFLVYLFVQYVRWKRAKPKKVSEPKTEHISEGCKSWCSSLCC